MAERIVSPGVFTREKDLSFLPQGIGEIGAALIGSTVKGPAFVPTTSTILSRVSASIRRVDIRFIPTLYCSSLFGRCWYCNNR
jgi:hypothetical protein